jgi:hypothetical protein
MAKARDGPVDNSKGCEMSATRKARLEKLLGPKIMKGYVEQSPNPNYALAAVLAKMEGEIPNAQALDEILELLQADEDANTTLFLQLITVFTESATHRYSPDKHGISEDIWPAVGEPDTVIMAVRVGMAIYDSSRYTFQRRKHPLVHGNPDDMDAPYREAGKEFCADLAQIILYLLKGGDPRDLSIDGLLEKVIRQPA